MDREAIARYDPALVETIESICFKGKTHLKRGSGLTLVPKKLLTSKHASTIDTHTTTIQSSNIAHELQNVFRLHFRGIDDITEPSNV